MVVLKLRDLGWQRSTPFDSKFFIYNRFVISQAECRGFDPRLPLHVFSNLGSSRLRSLLRLLRFLRRFRVRRRSRSIEHCGFESRYGFDLLLKIAHRVHFQAHTQTVPALVCGDLVVDVGLPRKARIRPSHYLEARPPQPNGLQARGACCASRRSPALAACHARTGTGTRPGSAPRTAHAKRAGRRRSRAGGRLSARSACPSGLWDCRACPDRRVAQCARHCPRRCRPEEQEFPRAHVSFVKMQITP